PINLPPPGEMPGHSLATSALQYARGSAALAESGNAMTASESNEAAVNRRIVMTGLFFWSGGLTQCRYQDRETWRIILSAFEGKRYHCATWPRRRGRSVIPLPQWDRRFRPCRRGSCWHRAA